MRVLWLSQLVPYPPIGGVLQRSYHLLRELASEFEVHLVALRQLAICPDEAALQEANNALGEFCASVRVFPLDWEQGMVPKAGLALRAGTGWWAYDVARFFSTEAHQYLSSTDFPDMDIVHADTIGLVPYAQQVHARATVLNHHNIESQMMERRALRETNPVRRSLMRIFAHRLRALEREATPRFDYNLVVSLLDGERLNSLVDDVNVEVVPNGVDTDFFDRPANTDPDSKQIVFMGSQSWYPNRDAVVYFLDEIWPLIIERMPQAEFVMIGREPCKRAREAAQQDSQVRVLGFVEDLRDEVARSAVFVMPFRDGGGARVKLLDALALRRAIVSTTLGAEGVAVKDRLHFILADDPQNFASSVVELLENPELRDRLGNQGRELVLERYDWNVVGRRIREVYRQAHALRDRQVASDAT